MLRKVVVAIFPARDITAIIAGLRFYRGETIKFPIINPVILLASEEKVAQLGDIDRVARHSIPRTRIIRAVTVGFEEMPPTCIEIVATTRAEPNTKVGTIAVSYLCCTLKPRGEFRIEFPETRHVGSSAGTFRIAHVIVVPTIIHNIGVHRSETVLRKAAFHSFETGIDALFRNGHHPVVPTIVLHTYFSGARNGLNVGEEVLTDHSHFGNGARSPFHVRPSTENAVLGNATERFPAVVARMAKAVGDFVLGLRKFRPKEKTIDIEGLTETHRVGTHTSHTAGTFWVRPSLISCHALNAHILHFDIVDGRGASSLVCSTDEEIFMQEMVLLFHFYHHADLPRSTDTICRIHVLIRLHLKDETLTSVDAFFSNIVECHLRSGECRRERNGYSVRRKIKLCTTAKFATIDGAGLCQTHIARCDVAAEVCPNRGHLRIGECTCLDCLPVGTIVGYGEFIACNISIRAHSLRARTWQIAKTAESGSSPEVDS